MTTKARPRTERLFLKLTGRFERTGGQAMTLCDQLPLGGIGETPEEALSSFLGCLKAYLDIAEKDGTLSDVLLKHGAKPMRANTSTGFSLTIPYANGQSVGLNR